MKKINRNRYNAYISFIRDPRTAFMYDELFWYENINQTLVATIVLDKFDNDYSVVIHKRNIHDKFEYEDCMSAFDNIIDAEQWLLHKASELEKTTDYKITKSKIFTPVYDEKKLHLYFTELSKAPQYSAARNLLSEIIPYFDDVDGNFIEQFQTTGFDARLWEIYLFCYFNEEGLIINRNYNAPDFLLSNTEEEISLEAVTIGKKDVIVPFEDLKRQTTEYIEEQNKNDVPLMYGSSLYGKTKHINEDGLHYWEYPHTKNKPFVLAIADFHEEFSMTWSTEPLVAYLYGDEHISRYDGKGNLIIEYKKINSFKKESGVHIPAGFFLDPANKYISAVIHSPCGTLAKFNRIGKQCGFDENNVIMKKSYLYYNPEPNATKPLFNVYDVDENSNETWAEGISVYHNPNAEHPLSRNFFPSAAHHFIENGILQSILPEVHVYSVTTQTIIRKK